MVDYKTTLGIEIALMKKLNVRRKLIVPNVSWGFDIHECDLLVISKNGYATEIEIKISKSDLIKDKEKRHQHKSNKMKYLYFAIPSAMAKYIEHVPARAGVMVVNSKGEVFEIAKPRINKNCRMLSETEMFKVARLGAMRILGLKEKVMRRDRLVKRLKEEKT